MVPDTLSPLPEAVFWKSPGTALVSQPRTKNLSWTRILVLDKNSWPATGPEIWSAPAPYIVRWTRILVLTLTLSPTLILCLTLTLTLTLNGALTLALPVDQISGPGQNVVAIYGTRFVVLSNP